MIATQSVEAVMQRVFVNRTLNMKRIAYVGFDMDHTLIRYNSAEFEGLAHRTVLRKLVEQKQYPRRILDLPFDFERPIRGLVLDRKRGNILKLNRYSGIRSSYHGTRKIDYPTQQQLYKSTYIDLRDTNFVAVDTSFSISLALLFSQLVDVKDSASAKGEEELPSYEQIAMDVETLIDGAHRDGSLKDQVRENIEKFIIVDPDIVAGLEYYKQHGKKLFVLTNSFYQYSKLLLDYAITPYLKDHKSWVDLFDIVITGAQKPRFFYDNLHFFKIDPADGRMELMSGDIGKGVYNGGCASVFTRSLKLSGDEILYIGDHIYGDILRLKKDCNWRTGLVVEELGEEIQKNQLARPIDQQISDLMAQKEPLEYKATALGLKEGAGDGKSKSQELLEVQKAVAKLDGQISELIHRHQSIFNPYWGEVMRIGNEESFFAYQVERYACVYMETVKDLLACPPRTYFRPRRRLMPHEQGG